MHRNKFSGIRSMYDLGKSPNFTGNRRNTGKQWFNHTPAIFRKRNMYGTIEICPALRHFFRPELSGHKNLAMASSFRKFLKFGFVALIIRQMCRRSALPIHSDASLAPG